MGASLNDKEFGSFTRVGSDDGGSNNDWAQRTLDVNAGSSKSDITGESISVSAGAAGTTGITSTASAPVLDSSKTRIGDINDTSFAWVTGLVLTTEVAYNYKQKDSEQLAALANGEFAIDYNTGRIRYCKATTATSDTANYTTKANSFTVSGTSDVNVAEVAGTATDVNNGSVSAGTQRVTLADDGTGVVKIWNGTDTLLVEQLNTYSQISSQEGIFTSSNLFAQDAASGNVWNALEATDVDSDAKGTEWVLSISNRTAAVGGSIEGTKVVDGTAEVGAGNPLHVQHTDGTNDMPTMDVVGRAGFLKITDGTNTALVGGGMSNALNCMITDSTGMEYQPAMNNATNRGYQQITDGSKSANVSDIDSSAITGDGLNTKSAICLYDSDTTTWLPLQFRDVDSDAKSAELVIPANLRTAGIGGSVEGTKITDGTNYLPTMDAVGRAGYVQVTDGTNTMPTMDDPQRTGIVQLTDGTNTKGVTSFAMASGAAGGGLSLLAAAGKGVFNKVYKMTLTCDTAETLTLSDGFGVYYCAAGVPVVIDFSISGRQGSENTAITVTTAGAANVGAMVEYVTV